MKRILCALLLSLRLACPAAHADWPQFRGPTDQGEVPAGTQLPLSWSEKENVLWKTAIPGLGWSSPIEREARIYLTTAVSARGRQDDPPTVDRSLRALCLDASSGKILWDTEVFLQQGSDANRIHKKNSYASPTPLLNEGKLFVHFGTNGTACLNLDGSILWKTNHLRYSQVHGNGGSPVIAGNKLIFSCDGQADPFVVALDTTTGAEVWRTPRNTSAAKTFSFCTPLIISNGVSQELVLPGSGNIFAYDPESGRELWRCNWGEGYSVVPRPVFGHGLIFASSGYDQPVLYAVRPGGTGDVTGTNIVWTAKKAVPRNSSFVIAGDYLFTVDDKGVGTCYQAANGKVQWQERISSDTSASLLHAGDLIYALDETGTCTVFDAKPDFKVRATNHLREQSLASMAVVGNDLLIRTAEGLYRIGVKP